MKLISYVGMDKPEITIERPTDLYPALDWIQTEMIELAESGHRDSAKFEACANFISKLLQQVEDAGFGSIEDVDAIIY